MGVDDTAPLFFRMYLRVHLLHFSLTWNSPALLEEDCINAKYYCIIGREEMISILIRIIRSLHIVSPLLFFITIFFCTCGTTEGD